MPQRPLKGQGQGKQPAPSPVPRVPPLRHPLMSPPLLLATQLIRPQRLLPPRKPLLLQHRPLHKQALLRLQLHRPSLRTLTPP